MSGWLTILVSGASGAAVTLLGVVTGGLLTGRSQRQQWARDKQIESCAVLVRESTRLQLALRRKWANQDAQDGQLSWEAWNQALAMIWLTGTPGTIAAARRMDRTFAGDLNHEPGCGLWQRHADAGGCIREPGWKESRGERMAG